MVDLPFGATEDRVCGTIDIEKALTEGTKAFEPGLLAKANRGILYVDEVNLLDDHLVDAVLLDSARLVGTLSSGRASASATPLGSSSSAPATLRRVNLSPASRSFRYARSDQDGEAARGAGEGCRGAHRVRCQPQDFRQKYEEEQNAIISKLTAARELLPSVEVPMDIRLKISQICAELDVDGLRGDLVTTRASCCCSLPGASEVTDETCTPSLPSASVTVFVRILMATIDEGTKVLEVFSSVFGYDSEE